MTGTKPNASEVREATETAHRRSCATRETAPSTGGPAHRRGPGERAMDDAFSEVAMLDDFQVIAERRQVSEKIAALIDRYHKLNQEMTRRATL
jgi:hypothetical protein